MTHFRYCVETIRIAGGQWTRTVLKEEKLRFIFICYHWAVVVAQLVEIRIQSLAILFTTYQLFYKLYLKDENKEKEAGKGPNLNLLLSFDWRRYWFIFVDKVKINFCNRHHTWRSDTSFCDDMKKTQCKWRTNARGSCSTKLIGSI